ncbi:hypothetical protein HZA98_02925 [Candidatus Woesearchaeota archaeon]|nr:hypothetical protein [Candidatus Woesearchaeota archaeon]
MDEKYSIWYFKHYKKLFFIPLLLVVLAFLMLAYNSATTGDILDKDVSLKGGTTATIYSSQTFPDLESQLKAIYPSGDFTVRELKDFSTNSPIGVSVEVSTIDADTLKKALEDITHLTLDDKNYTVEFIGGSLGDSFYRQMLFALVLAFLFMGLVVYVSFRVPIPSFMVIFSAFGDMLCTLAVMDLIGLKLSTSGIAAVLLLMGYSVDTDILLTTKLIKRSEGSMFQRLLDSAKTGLTMTAAALAALGVGYFFSTSYVLKEMFLIIIIGLLFDVFMTYGMNAGLLVWYLRRKKAQ